MKHSEYKLTTRVVNLCLWSVYASSPAEGDARLRRRRNERHLRRAGAKETSYVAPCATKCSDDVVACSEDCNGVRLESPLLSRKDLGGPFRALCESPPYVRGICSATESVCPKSAWRIIKTIVGNHMLKEVTWTAYTTIDRRSV